MHSSQPQPVMVVINSLLYRLLTKSLGKLTPHAIDCNYYTNTKNIDNAYLESANKLA